MKRAHFSFDQLDQRFGRPVQEAEETDVARAQAELTEARARYRAAQKLKGKR